MTNMIPTTVFMENMSSPVKKENKLIIIKQFSFLPVHQTVFVTHTCTTLRRTKMNTTNIYNTST